VIQFLKYCGIRIAKIPKERYFVLCFLGLSIPIISVNAIPVPLGVDGLIFALDGVTQVRSGVEFYVKNLDTEKIINGKIGHGSSGRYSVSISGNNGNNILPILSVIL
jgi:hypothetical protein